MSAPARWALTWAAMALLAACGPRLGEPLPPAGYDQPRLEANGALTGVTGVDSRHWALLDENLRRGVYWHSFLSDLVVKCPAIYPEHAAWMGELGLLVRRGTGMAVDRAVAMEALRLQTVGAGADRAAVGLEALGKADVDVPGIMARWLQPAVAGEIDADRAMLAACNLLFEREELRGLMRKAADPLSRYFARMAEDHPAIVAEFHDLEAITRRLDKI